MFGISVLTSAGAALIRKAIEDESKIVFTRGIASTNYESDRGDLSAKTLEFYDGADGAVFAVSTQKGNIQAAVGFSGEGDGKIIKSVCICAQLENDGGDYDPSDDVIFAACSDDNSGYVDSAAFYVEFDMPTNALGLVDEVGTYPNNSGMNFVSFDNSTLTIAAGGKTLEISATEAE